LQVDFEIQEHLELLKRDARVRVKQWLQKFRQETANAVWKRNRNTHARLLLEQLRTGRLAHPFTSLPGPGPLPTLGRWALAPFLTPQKKSASPRSVPTASNLLQVTAVLFYTVSPKLCTQFMQVFMHPSVIGEGWLCRDEHPAEALHAMSCPAKLAAGTDACDTGSPLASTSGAALD